MANLDSPVSLLKGVGTTKAKDFERINIRSLRDVLFAFPFRHDDLSHQFPIAQLVAGQKVTVRGTIAMIQNRRSKKNPRMMVTEAMVEDGTGSLKVVWFHQGFLTKTLKPGKLVSLSGKIDDTYGMSLVNPVYEIVGTAQTTTHTGRIVPIYHLTGSLTQKLRRNLAEKALESVHEVLDWLPEQILSREAFVSLGRAVASMHFPESTSAYDTALTRLKFDEFFLHQLLHGKARRELQQQKATAIPFAEASVKAAIETLPFALTAAQKKATWAIIKDMERSEPMNRLLEGDVGTGKTVVAALSAVNVASGGAQSAFLAPTELLADQHATNLEVQFGSTLTIALFTRTKRRVGKKTVTKKQLLEALANGKIDLVVGTHALLSQNVLFNRLGLIIVDEQHRFGVNQRKALKDREGDKDGIPHLLSMTATPIPRSLALVLYGDLDRSLLNEYPAGRKPIETSLLDTESKERAAYAAMRDQMDQGRQCFVVCPLIDESDVLGVQSVNEVYAKFNDGPFADYRLAMLHGKMKTKEKDAVMAAFVAGEIDMVVATTVVEVGVDVPNASVMFIEGAERFGLAQLHQLRGRVGRAEHASFCYLHPTGVLSDLAKKRLRAVVLSQNGFELADKDLELRGPGNIFGTEQSGFESFKLGTYADRELIERAKDYATAYLDEDSTLQKWPEVFERVHEFAEEVHFE